MAIFWLFSFFFGLDFGDQIDKLTNAFFTFFTKVNVAHFFLVCYADYFFSYFECLVYSQNHILSYLKISFLHHPRNLSVPYSVAFQKLQLSSTPFRRRSGEARHNERRRRLRCLRLRRAGGRRAHLPLRRRPDDPEARGRVRAGVVVGTATRYSRLCSAKFTRGEILLLGVLFGDGWRNEGGGRGFFFWKGWWVVLNGRGCMEWYIYLSSE